MERGDYRDALVVVGKNIRRLREERQIRKTHLADYADITAVYLKDLENGLKGASVPVLCALARALECGVGELLAGVDAKLAVMEPIVRRKKRKL